MRVDQCLPDFAPHDAIGNHVLQVQRLLRAEGIESDIWADVIHRPVARRCRPYRERPRDPSGVLMYHASTFSDMAPWVLGQAEDGQRVWGDYHNITPAKYFARWEPTVAEGQGRARRELAALAPVTEMALAVSAYNEQELVDAGYTNTATAPLLVDLEEYHRPPDSAALARLARQRDAGGARWLFVGRLAPNKCAHDVIGAFACYRQLYDPRARLSLVGSPTSGHYLAALQRLVAELELGDAVELAGSLPFAELLAHFAMADVFVCLSEHEGFCVPVVEAMELGLPVVAYAAAALPETVADGGVLLDDKDPLAVAVAVGDLLADPARLEHQRDAGRARAEVFSLPRSSARFLELVHQQLAVP